MRSPPGAALASRIACRREPRPLPLVLRTLNVAGPIRSSRLSTRGVNCRRLCRLVGPDRGRDENDMAESPCGKGLRYNDVTVTRRADRAPGLGPAGEDSA